MQIKIIVNKCKCGWYFPALNKYIKKCPQCRDEQRLCIQCGQIITGHHHKIYCDNCIKERKKILRKYNNMALKEKNKYTFSDRNNDKSICNYDCNNCTYSECLLPIDKDDYYDNETIKMFDDF